MRILDELYERYEIKTGCKPKIGEAQKRFGEVWDRAENVLGEELGEELRDRMFAYMEEECSKDFQTGIRLGAQLMLDLRFPGGGEQSI